MQCLKEGCNGHYEPICTTCEVPKWIKVSERLPDEEERVLVYWEDAPYHGIVIDYISYPKDGNLWSLTNKEIVNAWMPLPSIPEV